MFIKILIFTFVATYVTAQIPPYIHVCGRSNPKLDECVMNSIVNLKSKLCEGISELDVVPLEPLHLSKLTISETNSAKLYLRNMQILSGICNFVIKDFHINLNKNYFNGRLLLKNVFLNSTYDFDIRILVPIVTSGDFSLTAEHVDVYIESDLKTVIKNNKKYVYVSKITMNLEMKNFKSQFENNDSDQLRDIIQNFIGNNQKEIFATIKPALEEALSRTVLSISNNIVKHFTYDELFPDRI